MAANKRAKGRRINNQERGGEGEKKKESQEEASRVSDSLGSSGQSALSWPLQGKDETRGKRERESTVGSPWIPYLALGWACSRQRPSCQPLESTWHSFLVPEIKCSTQGGREWKRRRGCARRQCADGEGRGAASAAASCQLLINPHG